MAVRDFSFGGPGDRYTQGDHTIYFKSEWSDPWVAVGNEYHCLECSFSVSPTMPTAMIQFAYGSIFEIGGGAILERLKTEARARTGQFVKIEIVCRGDNKLAVWYGRVDNIDDRHRGLRNQAGGEDSVASGVLNLTCYGLEKTLADTVIRHAFTDETANGFRVEYAPIFNGVPGSRGLVANRSENDTHQGSHTFASRPNSNAGHWSSKSIVEYLVAHHPPLNHLGIPTIPLELDLAGSASGVPVDWDRPRVSMQNQTLYSLINQVIDRRRLQVWWLEVDEFAFPHKVKLRVNTLTSSDIPVSVPNSDPIGENNDQVKLKNIGVDPLTMIAIRKSALTLYDQVIVTGARSRHVGSFSYVDGTIVDGWTASAEADYEQAASNGATYGAQSRAEKQRRNDRARRLPAVRNVFAAFKVPDDWDFRVDNGENSGTTNHMFPDELGLDNDQWLAELFIERSLPLLTSVDYSGSAIADDGIDETPNNDGEELRPIVLLRRPDRSKKDVDDGASQRWIRAEDVGAAAQAEPAGPQRDKLNDRFSLFVEVPPNSRVVYVKVNGAPQHAIAHAQFTPLADDPHIGDFDFATGMVFTVSMRSHLPVFVAEPEFPAETDAVRSKLINAGEQYVQDYVAPNTVVGIDPDDGSLLRSTGGWIPAVGSADDPRPRLESIAKIAAKWYTEQHFVAVINTAAPLGPEDLQIGDMITEVEDDISGLLEGHYDAIYSTVTEIKFSIPRGDGRQPTETQQSITTWAGELDTIGIQPFVPSTPNAHAGRGFPDRVAGPQPFLGDLMEFGPDGVGRIRPGAEAEAERRRQQLQQQLESGDPFAGKRPL